VVNERDRLPLKFAARFSLTAEMLSRRVDRRRRREWIDADMASAPLR
jgi:hypothetical protein